MENKIKLSNGISYSFPLNWNLSKIKSFINDDIKVCPYCSKVDIRLEHLNNCNGYNFNSDDNNWK